MNSDLRLCCSSLQSEVQTDSHQLPVQMPACERQGIGYRNAAIDERRTMNCAYS